MMRAFAKSLLPLLDLLLLPLVYPSAWVLKQVRGIGAQRLPACRGALLRVGVFPVNNHYYEPQFDHRHLPPATTPRPLPGVDWNVDGQLALLQRFTHADELVDLPRHPPDWRAFTLANNSFTSGDAEYWYQFLRTIKPRRVFEIGSGNSTLMAVRALDKNRSEDAAYQCEHVCVEPYEMPWLESTGVTVRREKVEDVDIAFFQQLDSGDVLFIDSSHIIRPYGDVLHEQLVLLPSLKPGVYVHVHDVFSPRNYPQDWLDETIWFWNEQYLLEAFLTCNRQWEIVGAVNYLKHDHYDRLKAVAPHLTPEREPGSFYLRRVE